MRLENWSVYNGCLVGRVYGHPAFDDGTQIITDSYSRIDTEKLEAYTKNNMYELGEPALNDRTICAKPEDL
jgi:hypothetical protein